MKLILFVPELWVIFGCLLLFMTCIFNGSGRLARALAGALAVGSIILTAATFYLNGVLSCRSLFPTLQVSGLRRSGGGHPH